MNTQWRYFTGAAVLASYVLVHYGAPILPVAMGVGIAALAMWHKSSRAS